MNTSSATDSNIFFKFVKICYVKKKAMSKLLYYGYYIAMTFYNFII